MTRKLSVQMMKECVAEPKAFEYESFFAGEIEKKKMDHSYRVFKKVSRDAANFPAAREFSWGKKEITVRKILRSFLWH